MIKLDSEFNKVYEELNNINEANKVVSRFSNPWYSGSFRGLNDISTAQAPKTPEQIAQEEEERKKREKEAKIQKAMLYKSVDTYHYRWRQEILSDPEWPAMDPETRERVYDPARKEELVKQSVEKVVQAQEQAYLKGLETKAANKAALARTYHWEAAYTIGGKTFTVGKNIIDNEDPEASRKLVKQAAVERIKQEMHECRVFGERFEWDGKMTITCTPPKGSDEDVIEYVETFVKRKAV
jgi:hypothetical protein